MRRRIPWGKLGLGAAFAIGIGFFLQVFAGVSPTVSWVAAGIFIVAMLIALEFDRR